MHPVIEFTIGEWQLSVSAYRLMLGAALVITVVIAMVVAKRVGIPSRKLGWVLAGSAVAAVAGARILAVVTTRSGGVDLADRLWRMSAGDFALFGGLIAGGLVGAILCRRVGLNPMRAADALAPAIGAGIFAMRIGCLLSGCCFGNPTHLPWGITYPKGSTAQVHQILSGDSIFTTFSGPQAVHPTPIYDMVAAGTGAVLAAVAIRRGWREGSAMAVFVLWYGIWRFALQPLRADTGATLMPEWFWPTLFLSVALTAGQWLLANRGTMTLSAKPRYV